MKSLLVLLMLGVLVSCGTEDTSSEGTDEQGTTPDPMVDQEPEPADSPDPAQDPEPEPMDEPAPSPADDPEPVRVPPEEPAPMEDPVPGPEEPVADLPEDNANLAIAQISLVSSAGNGSAFMDVSEIENGSELNLASITSDVFNIVAEPDSEAFTGSVQFDLAGPTSINRFENTGPYTLAPEPANLDTENGLLPGTYRLSVTAYEQPDLQGATGQTFSVSFDVISDEDAAAREVDVPSITAISVGAFNSNTNSFSGTLPVTDGTLIDLADYIGQQINFVAVSEDASQTGSVEFSLTGPEGFTPINRTENTAPYTVERDSLNFLEGGTALPDGEYTLTATPYELASAAGDAGATREVTFAILGVEQVVDTPVDDPREVPVDGPIEDPIDDTPPPRDDPSPPVNDIIGSDGGFTPIVVSADTRQVFVSNSAGNDANTCLTENDPCKSIEQGIERMREGFPDHLLLRRGDTWRVEQRALDGLPSGRSESQPAVLAYYGESGARPTIEGDGQVYRQDRRLVSHLRFMGLRFYGYEHDPTHPEFNPDAGTPDLRFVGRFNDIVVEDSVFEFAEMTVQAFDGNRPANFTIRRNIFNGSYSNISSFSRSGRRSNVFTIGVDGLDMRENVFDFGGWHPTVAGAGANQLSHCVYHNWQSDGNRTFFINNIVSRCASHGIQMRSGGLAEDNFFARSSIGILMGYNFNGREVPAGTIAHVFNNVVSEGQHMSKGDRACEGSATCTGALWGLEMTANSGADYRAENNIVSMLEENEDGTGIQDGNVRNLVIRGLSSQGSFVNEGNIYYRFDDPNQGVDAGYADPERTLATYNADVIGGAESYDEFMGVVTSRPVGTWDDRYTASAINDYIRAGFQIVE